LSKGEIRILAVLARSPDKVFSKQEIIHMAFGEDAGVTEQGVGAEVERLCGKLEPGAGNLNIL
jgi:DNA-binding response OmpR family regulator